MPRYFLHQMHKGDCIVDDEGDEFSDLAAVKTEAVLAAREIMADRLIKGDELDHSRFEVKDEEGRTVLVLPFTDALPKSSG